MRNEFRPRALPALALALCLAVLACFAPKPVEAYGLLDPERDCSVSMAYHPSYGSREGIEFSLYRIGDVNEGAGLSFTEEWAKRPLSMDGLTVAGWANLANTVAGYVAQDGGTEYRPAATARTDRYGDIKFEGLDAGVYVLIGEGHSASRTLDDGTVVTYHYEPRPEAVLLPFLSDDEWTYDRSMGAVKYEVEDTRENPTVDRRVLKVWNDYGYEARRPSSVEVALLRDGEIYDVQSLDNLNNWRYDWTDLDSNHTWRVVELSSSSGYYTSVSRSGGTFVVTNTYRTPDTPRPPYVPPYTPPSTPDVPEPPVTPGTPDITVTTPPDDIPDEGVPLIPWVTPSTPTTPEGTPTETLPDPDVPLEDLKDPDVPLEDLPQTGQVWWPVAVLGIAAVVLFGTGAVLAKGGRKDDE